MTVVFVAGDASIRDNAATILIHENQTLKFIDELEELYGKNALFVGARSFIQEGYIALHKGLKFKQQEEKMSKEESKPEPNWTLREERKLREKHKEETQSDLKSDAVDKLHQMAFDCIYKALYELEENNHDMSVHCLDMAINSIKCKMNVKYGNSPWDPR